MPTGDQRQRFNEIVEHLTSDDPRFAELGSGWWDRLGRPVRAALLAVAGIGWALLCVAMVAWGRVGVLLTVSVVGAMASAAAGGRILRRRGARTAG